MCNAAYFSCNRAPALIVVRSPWTAADALVGLSRLSKALVLRTKERVQGTRAHQGVRAPLTSGDGTAGFGVVYKLDTAGQQTVLHSFAGGAAGACWQPLRDNRHLRPSELGRGVQVGCGW